MQLADDDRTESDAHAGRGQKPEQMWDSPRLINPTSSTVLNES